MRFRFLSIATVGLVILAGCGGGTTRSYRLTFDTQDPSSIEELTAATLRVMERRVDHLGATLENSDLTQDAESATMEVTLDDAAAHDGLAAEMVAPFDIAIFVSTDDAEPDVTIEGHGGFNLTSVTGSSLINLIASENEETGLGQVLLRFTPDGIARMEALFTESVGKDLGILVRGQLVSKLHVSAADFPEQLIIDGIPDPELGRIFADDVNIGLHVTVTPL